LPARSITQQKRWSNYKKGVSYSIVQKKRKRISTNFLAFPSLFSTVNREISEENSLWLLRVLIQTKRNAATVRDLLLC